ncbi:MULTISPECIES: response regulator transcription factor [unclassified Serratia (in: enterobacteria)]|uniref:response regulator transcription factor n=1 Tax=unclassified Serratia (in: enterobacteria) TaxID=2647522 RepID=UPI002ED52B7A|nr:response regulator transcription factor [Serratia sp. C2(2)]MEE4449338.1 response regulator transcription factor [Serratia sp. C2(1)]
MDDKNRIRPKLAVSDKYPIIQYSLCSYIKGELGYDVEFGKHDRGFKNLIEFIKINKIDIIITDLFCDVNDNDVVGFSKLRTIRDISPESKIILYIESGSIAIIKKAMNCGVSSIVSKSDAINEIKYACESILDRRGFYLSEVLTKKTAINDDVKNKITDLTVKEWEIVRLFSLGHSLSQIAEIQSRSVSTVSTQKYNAMKKLKIKSNSELIKYAYIHEMIR